jgi:hypothetical protein
MLLVRIDREGCVGLLICSDAVLASVLGSYGPIAIASRKQVLQLPTELPVQVCLGLQTSADAQPHLGETHEDVRQWVEGRPGSDVRIRFVREVTSGQACDRDWRKHRHRNGDSSRAGVERLTRLDVRSQRGEGRCCNREQSAQNAHQTLPPVWSVLLVPERCAVSRMLLFSVSACPETRRRHAEEYRRKG